MKKNGLLNRGMADLVTYLGHTDEMVIADCGLPLPKHVNCIDLTIQDNVPTVLEIAQLLQPILGVEKLVFAHEAKKHNPSYVQKICALYPDADVGYLDPDNFKKRTHSAKGIIRTTDFTSWGNVIIVTGSNPKYHIEIPLEEK